MKTDAKLPPISEEQFQTQVIQLAKLHGWRIGHFRAARTAHGWRTPVAADGAGFSDLLLIKGKLIFVAELKSQLGKVSPEQEAWLAAFAGAGVPAFTWRPNQWDSIVLILSGQADAR